MALQIDRTEQQTSKPFVIGVFAISVLYLGWALFTSGSGSVKSARPITARDTAGHETTRTMSLRVIR
jgi:hypothetical protein